ncbi:right-handed parallel beta-helix repeat-containing protein [Pedobacter endophyticus]|uniref:Right-handed parallel beta-helix repeat-containing protein n=1 Tax=Pedobacter endophyticus TaxID=2789740 RepID=A0A7S9KZZ8_9SPHI|nr:right-handed parallel beta-helix repeat-containing protein [Pedobacter endophyticus]QPH39940.1 right-handed parallel beta-helix repeat-containing protein [Pedobacter endophyticus]
MAHIRFFLGVVFFLTCNICVASTYYLSSISGDDNRSASEAQNPNTPWKSITKLNAYFASLKPGDNVLFKRNETFYGTISINGSGSDGNPITFGAYGTGSNPIITSLVTVSQWQSVGNGIYESTNAAFGSSVAVVLINNKPQEMGRYPNSDAANKGYLTVESNNGKSLSDSKINSGNNWKGADVVIRKMHWIIDRHPITSHSGATISYTDPVGRYFPANKFGYFIQNDIRTLDKFGEWYYNPASKKISVYFGSTPPSSSTVEVSTLDNLIYSDRPDGRFTNFTFENLTLRGANAHGVSISFGKNYTLRNCNIEYLGNCGLNAYSVSNFTVENCNFIGAQNNGVYLNEKCNGAVVRNNTIQNTMAFPGLGQNGDHKGLGMYVGGDNILVEYNKVMNTGYIGIYFAGESINVKNNLVDGFCLLKDDGSGIYTFSGDSNYAYTNRKVTGNIILNGIGAKEGTTSTTPPAKGFYADDNSAGIEVSNNTIASITDQGIFVHNGRNMNITGNTVFNNGTQVAFAHDDYGNAITNVSLKGNILFSKTADQNILKMSNKDADIAGMGKHDNNYYPRPFDSSNIINVEQFTNTSSYSSRYYDLAMWQSNFKQDLSTVNSPVKLSAYKVNNLVGANRYPNGKFDGNVGGTVFYASSGAAAATWDNSNKLGSGGSVKLAAGKPSFLLLNIGAVDASKKYILKFNVIGNKEANITAFLRQYNSPHSTISSVSTVKVQTSANTYECLFSFPKTEANACITFGSDNNDLTYWLDNVELYEANVTNTNPDDHILFEYNASQSPKSISLNGTYVDAKNVRYSGSVTIAPYASIVLIRTSAAPANVTPAAPVVTGDDKTNILSGKHDLYGSDIVVSENGGAFQAYTAAINVGNVDRPAGYWKFKIKAADGRNESAEVPSPAFTMEMITPTPPVMVANDVKNTLSVSHAVYPNEIIYSVNNESYQPYAGEINVGNASVQQGYWKFKIRSAKDRNESEVVVSPVFTQVSTPTAPKVVANDELNTLTASHDTYASGLMVSINDGAYQPYTGPIDVGNVARPSGYWKFKISASNDRTESTVVSSPAFTTSIITTTPAPPSLTADDNANTLTATHSNYPADIMFSENNGTYQLYTGVINVGNVARPSGYWKFKVRSGEGRTESSIVSSPAFTETIITTPAPPSLTADDNANTLTASQNNYPADIMFSENNGTYQLYTGVINVGNVARPSGYWKFKVRSGEGRTASSIVSSPAFTETIITTPAPPSLTADDTANTLTASQNNYPADIIVSENNGTYKLYTGVINVGNVARPSGYWKFKVRSGEGRTESSIVSSPAFTTSIITTTPAPPSLTADDTANTLTASQNNYPADIMVSENNGTYQLYTGVINVGNVARPSGYWKFKVRSGEGRTESSIVSSPAFTETIITTPAPPSLTADDTANTLTASQNNYPADIMFSENNGTYQLYTGVINVGNVARPSGYWKFKVRSGEGRTESNIVSSPSFTETIITTTPAPPSLKADDTANTLTASHDTYPADIMVSENGGEYKLYTGTINVGNVARPIGYWRFKISAAAGRNESILVSSPAFTRAQAFLEADIVIYPVPVQTTLHVKFPAAQKEGTLEVVAMDGRVVKRATVANGNTITDIDVSNLPTGTYILLFKNGNDRFAKTFIKM